MNPRWKVRPEGSTWGDWGQDDQLGRLNLLTPQKVLEGIAEVKEGLNFCLSLPLNLPGGNKLNPARGPYTLRPTQLPDGTLRYLYPACLDDPHFTDVGCDDRVDMVLQYATQWDTLAHVGSMFDADGDGQPEIRFYNGYQGHVDVKGPVKYHLNGTVEETGETTGARKLGVENMAEKGMQGRGVMVDLERHFGETRHYVGYDDWMRALEATNVEVTPGDMLLIYTGFADYIMDAAGDPDEQKLHNSYAVLNGRDRRLQQWIADSGIAVICADNYAVEGFPSRPAMAERYARLPLHELCLFKLGVNIGELWYLGELARWLRAHNRTRFLLTAPPLRLPGAVGSPASPIATV